VRGSGGVSHAPGTRRAGGGIHAESSQERVVVLVQRGSANSSSLVDNITQAMAPQRLPVVLTQSEVKRVLDRLEGTRWLMASLLYGAGLRLLGSARGFPAQLVVIAQEAVSVEQPALLADFFGQQFEEP
jgi:hypothetical protein